MSCLGGVEPRPQADQTVHRNAAHGWLTPTTIKVAGLVLGFLLVGGGVLIHFLHVNAVSSCVIGVIGGAAIFGIVVWSIVDCLRGKRERVANSPDVQEALAPEAPENGANELLNNNYLVRVGIWAIYNAIKVAINYSPSSQRTSRSGQIGQREEVLVVVDMTKQNADSQYQHIDNLITQYTQRSIYLSYREAGSISDDEGVITIELFTFVDAKESL